MRKYCRAKSPFSGLEKKSLPCTEALLRKDVSKSDNVPSSSGRLKSKRALHRVTGTSAPQAIIKQTGES